MNINVVTNGCFQTARAAKDTAAQLRRSQETKPALHKIDPRSTGGCEVEVEARMLQQPALNGGSLMSAIVVEDEMNIQCGEVSLRRHELIESAVQITLLRPAKFISISSHGYSEEYRFPKSEYSMPMSIAWLS